MGSSSPGPNPLYALTPGQIIAAQSAQWRELLRGALADTRCACPGFLTEDLNADKQTVTVQLAIQERVRVVLQAAKAAAAGGPPPKVLQWWDVPPIVHVPIMTPRGGGYAVTLPLKKGDEGMVIFCDACIDNWWVNGQTNSPVAANTGASSGSQRQNEVRRHYVHDCGFYPGLWSQKNLLTNYSADSLQIRSDDGTTVIDVSKTDGVTVTTGATIQLTAPAVNANADAGTPQALMTDTFYQWYKTNIQPFLVGKGYVGPAIPLTGCETTVLKGQ